MHSTDIMQIVLYYVRISCTWYVKCMYVQFTHYETSDVNTHLMLDYP